MKKIIGFKGYLIIYILFVFLYGLSFKNAITPESLKICLYSSIVPALVGGTVTNLLFKNH